MEALQNWQEPAVALGLKLIAAIVIFIVGKWVARIIQKVVLRALTKSDSDETLKKFIGKLTYYALLTFVILAAIAQLGVQTTSFIAVLGAAGLAIGLALQGSLGNFASGVLLIVFKPFKVGDFVEAAGTSGTVLEVSIFTTTLKTADNKKVIIPNSNVTGDNITNYSAHDTRRVDLTAGIGYNDDIDKARDILNDIISKEERVLADPAPTVAVVELADSSVNFVVRPWVATSDYWPVYFELTEQIKKRFDEAGVSIPFPQRDVHVYNHEA